MPKSACLERSVWGWVLKLLSWGEILNACPTIDNPISNKRSEASLSATATIGRSFRRRLFCWSFLFGPQCFELCQDILALIFKVEQFCHYWALTECADRRCSASLIFSSSSFSLFSRASTVFITIHPSFANSQGARSSFFRSSFFNISLKSANKLTTL